MEDWREDIKQDIERTERAKQREIEQAEIDLENVNNRLEDKKQSYDDKLKAIDDAMGRIEEVSKAAAIQAD